MIMIMVLKTKKTMEDNNYDNSFIILVEAFLQLKTMLYGY